MSATIFREVPSYVGQFGVYEVLKTQLTPEGEETANLSAARTVRSSCCLIRRCAPLAGRVLCRGLPGPQQPHNVWSALGDGVGGTCRC